VLLPLLLPVLLPLLNDQQSKRPNAASNNFAVALLSLFTQPLVTTPINALGPKGVGWIAVLCNARHETTSTTKQPQRTNKHNKQRNKQRKTQSNKHRNIRQAVNYRCNGYTLWCIGEAAKG
jgi:hypothetical protein